MLRCIIGFLVIQALCAQSFLPAVGSPFKVGNKPIAVAIGEFNRDGYYEFAVANHDDKTVSVLLNNQHGGFAPAPGSPFAVGGSPVALVTSNFHNAYTMDLAVANEDGTVTVLLGDGSGGFAPSSNSPVATGLSPVSMATADFNQDGRTDLAILDKASNSVTILLGDGQGGFARSAGSPFAAGSDPRAVVVADFNRDGRPDLAVSNGNAAGVTILLGNGSGGFTQTPGSPFAAGVGASAMVAADLNLDSKVDLVVLNSGANSMTVLLGDGKGGFAPSNGSPFATGGMPSSVAAANFTGNITPDIAVTSATDNTLTILVGDGKGGFTAGRTHATGQSPVSLAAMDLNNDAYQDFVIANSGSNDVTVLFRNQARNAELSIAKTHVGSFAPGQIGANYTLTVSNPLGAPSTGTVTVTDTPPAGLTLVAMSGSGWSCFNNACTRSDILDINQSFPPITATFNVAGDITATVVNQASVSGGGSLPASGSDTAAILPLSGVYFNTVPSGAPFTIDGSAYTTPFTIGLSAGTHVISPAAFFNPTPGVQYLAPFWAEPAGNPRTITVTAGQPATYVATYSATQYLLTTIAVPPFAGMVFPPTGFANSGVTTAVAAKPNPNFQFSYWQGPVSYPLNGSSPVKITGPLTVTAYFTLETAHFITALYQDLLNRAPERPGSEYWANELLSGNYTQSALAAQFFSSPEFSNNGLYVIKLYISILKRDPDFTGWKYWVDQLRAGTPPISVLNSFITAPEFTMLYGNATNQDLVTLLYRNVLGREPDSAGLGYWLGLINNGTYTRATLTDQFVRSPEFDRSVMARAYANLLYMGFLRRTADSAGLAYWMGVLADPTALQGAIGSFITSLEYLGRF